MKKHYYIKQERPRLPLSTSVFTYMAMDYYNAPQWLWGCLGLLFLIGWIAAITMLIVSEPIDLNDLFSNDEVKKSNFQKRLEEMAKQRSNK